MLFRSVSQSRYRGGFTTAGGVGISLRARAKNITIIGNEFTDFRFAGQFFITGDNLAPSNILISNNGFNNCAYGLWFKGISIETEAKVFYPEHISRKLTKQLINTNDIKSFDLQNIIELLPKFVNIEDKLESFILYIDIENCSVRYTRDILGKKFNLKIITAVDHDNILLLLFELLVWVIENRYMK